MGSIIPYIQKISWEFFFAHLDLRVFGSRKNFETYCSPKWWRKMVIDHGRKFILKKHLKNKSKNIGFFFLGGMGVERWKNGNFLILHILPFCLTLRVGSCSRKVWETRWKNHPISIDIWSLKKQTSWRFYPGKKSVRAFVPKGGDKTLL